MEKKNNKAVNWPDLLLGSIQITVNDNIGENPRLLVTSFCRFFSCFVVFMLRLFSVGEGT